MQSTGAVALSFLLAAGVAGAGAASAADAPRVAGEPGRTVTTKSRAAWRSADFPDTALTRLRYGEMSPQRILKLAANNTSRRGKPVQIGIARDAAGESAARALSAPHWVVLADGSSVTRIELTSPVAYGIRAGLEVAGLDPRAELRFAGSSRPDVVVATLRGDQVLKLAREAGLFWTPATEGETQTVEIWLPAGASRDGLRLGAPRLSHLMTNALDDFRILEKVGESGSCNIDTVCRASSLGQAFADARAAVARMTFVADGLTYMCSGTLLNDTDSGSQKPYFHTADHCIGSQAVAATVNTYWNYESTGCDTDTLADYVVLGGGADHLYSSPAASGGTDGSLLLLRDAAPAGAYFSGWDAGTLASSSAVTAIHHPNGDVKKVSFGQHQPADSDALNHAVAWLEGTTEFGSSGSGLFTADGSGYLLRGGLYGGDASCANSGSPSNAGNVDWYSRFDVDFPDIRQYLAPAASTQPRRRNGAQPLATP